MFDDQLPKNNGQIPGNLPAEEPQDIFSSVDDSVNGTDDVKATPSALDAGVLKPKVEENTNAGYTSQVSSVPPIIHTMPEIEKQETYNIKGPAIGKWLGVILLFLVLVGILGGGGWWFYNNYYMQTDNTAVDTTKSDQGTVEQNAVQPGQNNDNNTVDENLGENITDDQLLFGEPIDKDADGLDDAREVEIKTDPNNWDTDGDELSDGDEVTVWKTNPLNPDTDGDSYFDGIEVKGGYNPAGPGKIFEPPTTTSTTTTTI